MGTIKEFNVILNKSDTTRFNQWQSYRDALTKHILHKSKGEIDRLLVMGAGNCDDLNIQNIRSITKQLYLSDIDEYAMNGALKKYKMDPSEVKLIVFEYTGASQNSAFGNLVKTFLRTESESEIDRMMSSLKRDIIKHTFPNDLKNRFDMIIVSPIYTQLLFQQVNTNIGILSEFEYPEELIAYLKQSLLKLMPVVIDSFNKNVVNLLKPGGHLFVISDIFESENDSKFAKKIRGVISDKTSMEKLHQDYQKKYGPGLGDFGIINMNEYLTIKDSKWFEWPFSKDTALFVKVVEFHN